METQPRVAGSDCGESTLTGAPRQYQPTPWKEIIPEYIKGPRRRRKFARKLHLKLLWAQEDIAYGERFPTYNIEGDLHWSRKPAGGQSFPNYTGPASQSSATPTVSDEVISQELNQPQSGIAESSISSEERPLQLDPALREGGTNNTPRGSESRCEMSVSTTQRNNGGVSPSSSPRLPSPPPSVEVQFGPKSPSISGAVSELSLDKVTDEGASRRIRPGTRAVDMARGPPFVPLHQVESPFQLQEYLQSLYAKLTRDEVNKRTIPINKEMALQLATPPTAQDTGEVVDRNLWLYELCRILCNKTSRIIVGFFADNPPCSSQTCPEMRASEWQYLCAVHEPPKSCCAIDYCNHTLDWASNILSSPKHFPSRLALGGEGVNAYQSMRQLTNVFRRVYRIYAHAWFQHREVFWSIESELGLYMFFKTVCDQYHLIPEDNYTIPPEAEGERDDRDDMPPAYSNSENVEMPPSYPNQENTGSISILRRDNNEQSSQSEGDQANSVLSTGATTRRHKHTPSTGVPIDVIAEGQEDEDEGTTMLDLGGPGPAEETGQAFLLPAARIERAKSPGLIAIPPNFDPERAPEDPTPVASYESSPFGGPSAAVIKVTSSDDNKNSPVHNASEEPSSSDSSHDQAVPVSTDVSVAIDNKTSAEVVEQAPQIEDFAALDSDTETQIAIEDVEDAKATKASDEMMEKIEVEDIKPQTKKVDDAKDEKLEDTKAADTEKQA